MNISFNVLHVLGLAYCLGAAHHFLGILKFAVKALNRDHPNIPNKAGFCLMLTICVVFLSAIWPITAVISLHMNKKGG